MSGKVQEDAKQAGMSVKTLRRAADDMDVVKQPPGGGRNCTWDLPNDVKNLMGLPVDGVEETLEDAPEGPLMEDGEFFYKLTDSDPVEMADEDLSFDDDDLASLLGGS
jgi:hypothetical protein